MLVISGSNFLWAAPNQTAPDVTKLVIGFTQANGRSFTAHPLAGGSDSELRVAIPDGVVLGISQITVTRPDAGWIPTPGVGDGFAPTTRYTISNTAQINPENSYVFVAVPEAQYTSQGIEGDLDVIDGDPTHLGTSGSPGSFGSVVAKVQLSSAAASPLPRDVAVTPDGTRAYVTLRNTGQVAVVDALTLQEVDVNAALTTDTSAPTGPIVAPSGVLIDPALRLARLSSVTDIRGTISLPGVTSWKLELGAWELPFRTLAVLGQGTKDQDSAVLGQVDPTQFDNGVYLLRLTATIGNDTFTDITWIGLYAKPKTNEIDLPVGALPYDIAIDPTGSYAYVADSRPHRAGGEHVQAGQSSEQSSYVYVIDINPASHTYNQVVNTIELLHSDPLADGSMPQLASADRRDRSPRSQGHQRFGGRVAHLRRRPQRNGRSERGIVRSAARQYDRNHPDAAVQWAAAESGDDPRLSCQPRDLWRHDRDGSLNECHPASGDRLHRHQRRDRWRRH